MTIGEMRNKLERNVDAITASLSSNWQGRCLLWVLRRLGWSQ